MRDLHSEERREERRGSPFLGFLFIDVLSIALPDRKIESPRTRYGKKNQRIIMIAVNFVAQSNFRARGALSQDNRTETDQYSENFAKCTNESVYHRFNDLFSFFFFFSTKEPGQFVENDTLFIYVYIYPHEREIIR